MAINDRVLDHTVSTLHNDIVDYRRVIRMTTQGGEAIFVAFPPNPPPDWLTVAAGSITVYLAAEDFDATYRVLLEESPVYVTALNLFGLRAFSLSSGPTAPGLGAADPAALRDPMSRVAQAAEAAETARG